MRDGGGTIAGAWLPGVVCVGYTFGLGSMAKLGAASGWSSLSLVLVGTVLFGALLQASDRLTRDGDGGSLVKLLAGRGAAGGWLAGLVIAGVFLAQWTGLPVLMRQVAGLLYDGARLHQPGLPAASPAGLGVIAAGLLACALVWLWPDARSRLGKAMVVLVGLTAVGLGAACILAWVAGPHGPTESMPMPVSTSGLVLLGIALAMPTFLIRPWLTGGLDPGAQNRDAALAALLLFVLCGSMLALMAVVGPCDGDVRTTLRAIEATAGKWAAMGFALGALGAGLTSVLPMLLILPVLLADYCGETTGLTDVPGRALMITAAGLGASGPLWGDGLLEVHRAAGQAAQVFLPPLVVGGLLWMLNQKFPASGPRADWRLGSTLGIAWIATLAGSGTALRALWGRLP